MIELEDIVDLAPAPQLLIYHWYRINKETGEIGPIAWCGNRIDAGSPVYPNGEPCSECMWKRNNK